MDFDYKIYGDGEIWRDGKLFAKIYSDGEIWQDGKFFAKIYSDGEIWRDGKQIGKIYSDGEIYVDGRLWGKVYINHHSSSSSQNYQSVSSQSNGKSFSGFGVPNVASAGDGVAGFFVAAFIVLLIVATIFGVFSGCIQLWWTFTFGIAQECGFVGLIGGLAVVLGVIIGFIIQYSLFDGRIIPGLLTHMIITFVTTLFATIICYGFGELSYIIGADSSLISTVGIYALMAMLPTLICKLVAFVAEKFR